jgi:glycerol-3-phosphate dehydrogenase
MGHDVTIIGGGVVGCALAMEFSRYDCRVVLLEARPDIGAGTSKANSAILHTGFDAKPGTLEARLVQRGYQRFHELAPELGLPIARVGGLVVAWTEEQETKLPATAQPVPNPYEREPHLGPGARRAALVEGESITCPFTPVLAYALTAVANGVEIVRGHEVREKPKSAVVINAAGLGADRIDALYGRQRFTVRPRKGEFLVYDKAARALLNHILLPIPTAFTKGVLVAPTVFGNVLVGPTAVELEDRRDVSTTREGLQSLVEAGRRILPGLATCPITSTYAGLRAATEHSDYQIYIYPEEGYCTVGGIRSTGLSAALGIAEYVVRELNLGLAPKREWHPVKMPPITALEPRLCERPEAVARRPAYGSIVCHCEWTSRAEIEDALQGPLAAVDLDGIRRRTRALMGRCQGFNCLAEVTRMLEARSG